MLVSKKKYDELKEQFDLAVRDLRAWKEKHDNLEELKDDLLLDMERLEYMLAKHEETVANENSVTLYVSDDLMKITPYVRVKDSMFDKMVETRFINDTVTESAKPKAMQLALMQVAEQGLNQIIDSFAPPIDEDDS